MRTNGIGHGSERERYFILSYDIGYILAIAPLSANSMAKMTTGLADNLLLSVVRAWDTTGEIDTSIKHDMKKSIVVAAAMNTAMWKHPITKNQIKVLENDWSINGSPG